MTAWLASLIGRPHPGRFARIDRDCEFYGSCQEEWTPTVRGDALVAQCTRCRRVCGVMVQRVADDWGPGFVD